MILYRFQDAAGRGPWTGSSGAWLYNSASKIGPDCSTMTGPSDDAGEELHKWWRSYVLPFDPWFATASIEQLLRWFPCEIGRAEMKRVGFVLAELDCPREHCVVGDTQVVYNKLYARLVRTFDIVTLEPISC